MLTFFVAQVSLTTISEPVSPKDIDGVLAEALAPADASAGPVLSFPWGYGDHDFKLSVVRIKDPVAKWKLTADCPLRAIFDRTSTKATPRASDRRKDSAAGASQLAAHPFFTAIH